MRLAVSLVVLSLIVTVLLTQVLASEDQVEAFTLENDLRVMVIHIPDSEHVSIFSFLPMGLTTDGPDQAQWSHLVEHLAIRSTVPGSSYEANAETLPDHMRLDFYGTLDNWQDGLDHHRQWLEGKRFSVDSLNTEKMQVLRECENVARNQATHKFAIAAWNQGCRHGKRHAAVLADVRNASLEQIQRYRDEKLFIPEETVICFVGGLDAKTIKPLVTRKLGSIQSSAISSPSDELALEDKALTWDLPTRHLVMTWAIPDPSEPDYAPLYLAGMLLQMRLFNDPELAGRTAQVLSGADLLLPEGAFFYVNAVVNPQTSFESVQQAIESRIQAMTDLESLQQAPIYGGQLAFQLTKIMNPALVQQQAPSHVSRAQIEGNLAIQLAMREFQFGTQRPILAKRLKTLTPKDVRQAISRHLAIDQASVITISPL